jgi:hypothetical protein
MRRRTFGKVLAGGAVAATRIGTEAAATDLKIGAIGSLSGGGTAWGLALQRGVQLAVDTVNRKRCFATPGLSALQDGCSSAQFHGISSSIRFWGQPLTRRVSRSAK